MKLLAGLCVGGLFGFGLTLSGMTDPVNVLSFLTISPNWSPQLAIVMASALAASTLGYLLVNRRTTPLFDTSFHLPTASAIDSRLLGGSALFGIGWGVAGFCPGPAIVGAFTLDSRAILFIAAYVVGNYVYEYLLNPSRALQINKAEP